MPFCSQIEKAINYTIQNTLNALEKDCDQVTELIHSKITEDNCKRRTNLKAGAKGIIWLLLALVFPLLTVLTAMSSDLHSFVGTRCRQSNQSVHTSD